MPWVKLDDGFSENQKILATSNSALRLHINAMCWAARNLSDGEVPPHALPTLRGSKKLAAELVGNGLWEPTSRGGFVIHDFLKYNPSRAEVEAERDRKRSAGKAGGQARAKALATRSASENPRNSGTPVPVPLASKEAKAAAPIVSSKRVTPEYLDELQPKHPTVSVRDVFEDAQNRKVWDGYKDQRRALLKYIGWAEEKATGRVNGRKPEIYKEEGIFAGLD